MWCAAIVATIVVAAGGVLPGVAHVGVCLAGFNEQFNVNNPGCTLCSKDTF